ncbi:MAG TPA: DUF2332 domain-containing protein [Euzebyales bacterium]
MADSMPGCDGTAARDLRGGGGRGGNVGGRPEARGDEGPPTKGTRVGDADAVRRATAAQLHTQARSCAEMGSPLYAHLLERAAADCAAEGPVWQVLRDHAAPARGDALALRFMAAVHRLVLQRGAPWLAMFYPSVGGSGGPDGAWEAFRAALVEHGGRISADVARPCQTNEVGRAAAIAVGLLTVVRATGMPLRLREVGASAGLNLRCDRFLIGGAGVTMGDPASPVDLSGHWRTPPPWVPDRLPVTDRRGCDRDPVDPLTAEGRLALTASVWADQHERHQRLRGALALAEEVPAAVDQAMLDVWARDQLAEPPSGVATVLYHSVVLEYVPAHMRAAFVATVAEAGERATPDRPLAWLRVEPVSRLRHHGVELTMWPGGATIQLARCGAHGADVVWAADDKLPPRG